MSGIYIHIPFCKTRCNYCDFYSDSSLRFRSELIAAIKKEIHLRKSYLPSNSIQTIYFGGGTPSLLCKEEFETIFDSIFRVFQVEKDAEITFEANPDDLSLNYLSSLSSLPFNRISIGIQSFDDEQLEAINRRHQGIDAVKAIKNAQEKGFENISIDLIYGLPGQTLESWEKQLNTALEQGVQHISAYGLSYEEGTVLWKMREKGRLKIVTDEIMEQMYRLLLERSQEKNYEMYEISNFALPAYRSQHNSAYWKQKPYLGIGPSAHSYDGISRQWNVASSRKYVEAISGDEVFWEKEELSLFDSYNDFVLVALRTSEGVNLCELEEQFGADLKKYFMKNIESFIKTGKAKHYQHQISLTIEGFLISNIILTQVMKV